jgi:hypothetical protein
MRLTPLSEVAELSDKTPIEYLKGKVIQVGKQFSGKKKDETPWTKQELEITDGTATITVQVWDKDPFPHTWKGQQVTIMALSGQRGQTGVYAHNNTYNGKTTRMIKVTDTGEVALLGAGVNAQAQVPNPAPQSAANPAMQRSAPASSAAVGTRQQNPPKGGAFAEDEPPLVTPCAPREVSPPPPPKTEKELAADANRRVAKRTHLMYKCIMGAHYAAKQAFISTGGELAMDAEQVQKCAVSLYMDCQRDGLYQHLPVVIEAAPPKAKAQQEGGAK